LTSAGPSELGATVSARASLTARTAARSRLARCHDRAADVARPLTRYPSERPGCFPAGAFHARMGTGRRSRHGSPRALRPGNAFSAPAPHRA